jgi:hypothetical protein
MPWVRTPAIASKDESHPFPDRAIGLPILRPHPARSPRLADRGAEPSPASTSDNLLYRTCLGVSKPALPLADLFAQLHFFQPIPTEI